jgi:hypothetical protein
VGISHGKSTEIHVFWTLQCDTDRNINMMTMAICITSQSSNHPSVGFEGVTFVSLIKQPDACWLFFCRFSHPLTLMNLLNHLVLYLEDESLSNLQLVATMLSMHQTQSRQYQ